MNAKEEWIGRTLESLDGMRSAESDPETYTKVMQRIRRTGERKLLLTPGFILKVAAGLTLLIGLNVFSMVHYHSSSKNAEKNESSLATDYFSYISIIKY